MEEAKKKKKTYCKPEMRVEEFTPNEYVGACWGVACSREKANTYEKSHYSPVGFQTWADLGCSHDTGHCDQSGNQIISTDAGTMTEVGTDGLGNLPCTIYSDANYRSVLGVSDVKVGDYIYWTTAAGNRVWHHQGTVLATNSTRPNMS